MAGLFGHLQFADNDRPFTLIEGQRVIYDETQKVFQRWNEELQAATSIFVQTTTWDHKERFKLPGNGYSQEEDQDNRAPSGVSKATGSWDVAYPLRQYGDAFSWSDTDMAYMTMAEYENHVQTVINKNNNTVFHNILEPIFNNVAQTFSDMRVGSLTIQCLANGDSVVYPPKFGTTTEATENQYLAPNYLESGISNTNNPFLSIRDQLEPHFGFPQGGSPIVALVNSSATKYIKLMPGFDDYTNRYLVPGDNITTLKDLPPMPPSGRIIGVEGISGVVVFEWPRIPSGWMIGIHLEALKPLKKRIDPPYATSLLGQGELMMVSQDEDYPFRTNRWRNRYGYGVANRLNGVVVALNGTSSYTIPSGY